MGSIVIKEAPDADFYVVWSSVVESWTFAGTRAETLAYLQRVRRQAEDGDADVTDLLEPFDDEAEVRPA